MKEIPENIDENVILERILDSDLARHATMIAAPPRRIVRSEMGDTRKLKGDIVEEIVASLHNSDDYIVQRKIRLPSRGDPAHSREIDVLVTSRHSNVLGSLAIECKNYGKRISPGTVSQFAGMLQEVGIPPERGAIVGTRSGFTGGALAAANFHHIQPLILDGLDKTRIAAEVHKVYQSAIYLRLTITQIKIDTDIPVGSSAILLHLRSSTGRHQGSIPDLVWADWRDGLLPEDFGMYEMKIRVPRDWNWYFEGQRISSLASVQFKIDGVVATYAGKGHRYALVNARTDDISKCQIHADFGSVENSAQIFVVSNEDDLNLHLDREAMADLVLGRIRLPRIVCDYYCPISHRVALVLDTHAQHLIRNRILPENGPNTISVSDLEGTDLATFWEPIWAEHPASKRQDWPWGRSGRQKRKVRRIT